MSEQIDTTEQYPCQRCFAQVTGYDAGPHIEWHISNEPKASAEEDQRLIHWAQLVSGFNGTLLSDFKETS